VVGRCIPAVAAADGARTAVIGRSALRCP